jgi:hypothetical protein
MQVQITPWDSSKAIGITFTDKPVIAFEGLALFVAFAQRIGLAPKLAEALSFVLTFLVAGFCFRRSSGTEAKVLVEQYRLAYNHERSSTHVGT